MSEMVERVAKALFESTQGGKPRWTFAADDWMDAARAAIEAMREPTGAMVAAAFDEGDDLIKARLWWQAMIDAALGEND